MRTKTVNMLLFAVIAVTVIAASQYIGAWINNNLAEGQTIEWLSFVHFTHVRNHGGVFGMLQGMGWLFGLLSVTLLCVVSLYLALSKSVQRYEYICFGFIVGGGASNIIDRLIYGSVIDFIDIQHIPFWNYIFNTADVMVHVGIWPMLLLGFYYDRAARAE